MIDKTKNNRDRDTKLRGINRNVWGIETPIEHCRYYKLLAGSNPAYLLTLCVAVMVLQLPYTCCAGEVNIPAIIQIESSGNPLAWNKSEDARGLMQIRAITLREWNNFHPDEQYTAKDLFVAETSVLIGSWYINIRVPDMLSIGGFPDTIENRLLCYNRGYSNFKKWYRAGQNKDELPKKAKRYLVKYRKLTGSY